MLLRWSGFTLGSKANDLLLGLLKKDWQFIFLVAGGAVHHAATRSLPEGSNLEWFSPTLRVEKQSSANWRSPLLIIAPVSVWLGHWRSGHVGEVLEGRSHREESCATNNNHRKIEYSRATGGRSEDKTLTHPKFWPYFFKLVLMEMENPHCGVIQEPGILKSSMWGGGRGCLLRP